MAETLGPHIDTMVIGGLISALILLGVLTTQRDAGDGSAIARLKGLMGLTRLPTAIIVIAGLFWSALFAALFVSLILAIFHAVALVLGGESSDLIRGDVILIAGLTATLGAVVALPFTLIRITLTQSQNAHAENVLFNEKISEATRGLYAQRQVTINKDDDPFNAWEDDIVRRNAAIDQLARLVDERPATAQSVAAILSVYVRELSKLVPTDTPPEPWTPASLQDWARALDLKRSDMESAVQTLGRLRRFDASLRIDLRDANLQAMDLHRLAFDEATLSWSQLQGANLYRTQLQGANLIGAQVQGARLDEAQLQGADLSWAQLPGANFFRTQLQGAKLIEAQLQGANLLGAQLQGTDLNWAQLRGANLDGADLQGADLDGAGLQGASLTKVKFDAATNLSGSTLRGAALSSVDFTQVSLTQAQVETVFGDATVKLPPDLQPPERFLKIYGSLLEFENAWHAWQKDIGFDPDDPST